MTINYKFNGVEISHWSEFLNIAKYQWLFVLSIGLFLSLFIIFFQPFGVTNFDPKFKLNFYFVFIMLSFGFVDSLVLVISEFLIKPITIKKITRTNFIIWIFWSYFLVCSTSFLYYNFNGNWHDFHWSSYFEFILNVGAVISFPILGFFFFLHHQYLKLDYSNFKLSLPQQPSEKMISFNTEIPKESLSVRINDLLYIKSENNYVAIFYFNNDTIQEHLIRTSLKQLEKTIESTEIQRCHRSYMVNLANVINCQQNHHNLILNLAGLESTIPVSRSFKRQVLEKLQEYRS